MTVPHSLVVTVSRDDADFLENLTHSMAKQTIKPSEWIIVDDSSNDETSEIISSFSRKNDWIKYVRGKEIGKDMPRGRRIAELFIFGIAQSSLKWDFCSKIDADMELGEDYFSEIFSKFNENPRLGIASGNCLIKVGKREKIERVSSGHTRGGLKTYRRECFDQISGVSPIDGWDTVDNIKSQILGWETSNFTNILAFHARPTGSRVGLLSNSFNEGKKSYFLGYFAPYLFARAGFRMFSKPFLIAGIAMLCGYLHSLISFSTRIDDVEVSRFIRSKQISKLTLGLLGRD